MPTALLADDEPLLLEHLQQLLAQLWPQLAIVGCADNGVQALEMLNRLQPDFAFLDIRMPGLSGLDVAAAQPACRVIFVSAFDQYALAAFDHAALDYLLKPVSAKRLASCISRLQQNSRGSTSALPAVALQPTQTPLQWLHVGLASQLRLVQINEVVFFHACDKYTEVVTLTETHLIRTPLKELIRQLPPGQFCQTQRAYIVRLDAIDHIEKDIFGRSSIYLKNLATVLPLSRSFAGQFRQM